MAPSPRQYTAALRQGCGSLKQDQQLPLHTCTPVRRNLQAHLLRSHALPRCATTSRLRRQHVTSAQQVSSLSTNGLADAHRVPVPLHMRPSHQHSLRTVADPVAPPPAGPPVRVAASLQPWEFQFGCLLTNSPSLPAAVGMPAGWRSAGTGTPQTWGRCPLQQSSHDCRLYLCHI